MSISAELPPKRRINLKVAAKIPSGLTGGHRLCRGCGAGVIARQATIAAAMLDKPYVVVQATGCLEVATTIYTYTAWNVPWLHNAFENAGATASGAEAAYTALVKKGRMKEKPNIIVFGGDGGTYDIGLQSLSGAIERGHDFLYICYDNGAYMNTGIQRSGGTPKGARTTTSPGGEVIPGKPQYKKDLIQIMWAHNIPVFTASMAYPQDLMQKVQRGLEYEGPAFMLTDSPCTLGWKIPDSYGYEVSKLAVETAVFPLFTAYKDEWELSPPSRKIALQPHLKKPVEEWLRAQGWFKHLFVPKKREDVIQSIQEWVDERWERLLARANNV